MKKLLILAGIIVSLTAAHVVMAQSAQGVITYENKINLHRRIPAEREAQKAMIPEFRTTKNQLFFNETESIFKPLIEDEDEEITGGGGGFRMMIRTPNIEIHVDNNSNIITTKQEFMGKEYLIEDTVKVSPWKFGAETKTIAGYECKQAYFTDEAQVNINGTMQSQKQEVTAWYTDKIRPFLGPERFMSLPGAVLAIDVNNGERVIVAKKIELRELKKNELKKPSGGMKTTQKEYRAIVEEQMKNMGRNGMIIRN